LFAARYGRQSFLKVKACIHLQEALVLLVHCLCLTEHPACTVCLLPVLAVAVCCLYCLPLLPSLLVCWLSALCCLHWLCACVCHHQVMDPQRRPPEPPPPAPVWKRVFGGRKVELPENVKGRCVWLAGCVCCGVQLGTSGRRAGGPGRSGCVVLLRQSAVGLH
jgi:hypothetical protein